MADISVPKPKFNIPIPKNLKDLLGKASYVPFILIILGIAMGGFAYTQYSRFTTLQGENKQESQKLEAFRRKLERLKTLSNQRELIEEDYELFFNAAPDSTFVPTFLGQIEAIAKETGVEINTLSYGGGTAGAGAAGAAGAQTSVDARVAIGASLSTMEAFLKKLENSLRLTEVTDFRYSFDQEGKVGVDLGLRAFYTTPSEFTAETPLEFDISGADFLKIADKLKTFSRYPVEIPEE